MNQRQSSLVVRVLDDAHRSGWALPPDTPTRVVQRGEHRVFGMHREEPPLRCGWGWTLAECTYLQSPEHLPRWALGEQRHERDQVDRTSRRLRSAVDTLAGGLP